MTNGIQDKGLAFEPGEGDELLYPPRDPKESIFDRPMVERIMISGLFMGIVVFAYFYNLIQNDVPVASAQNLTLLLMVLFENLMILNCRSETKSAFALNIFRNKFLLFGTLCALAVHVGSMFIPALSEVLGTAPVHVSEWIRLPLIAFSIVIVMEIYKLFQRKKVNQLIRREIRV